ncbi:inner membrane protein YrbG [Enterobacter cloacae]|uniref:Inner membrane protein YrbG n=1 Tax=Enterobacter cloacae TaxID=550 RepID=A0A377LS95_ENTCL|nr:inner membrane protein YrbG [Enterobacter cloacae]
MTAFSLLALAVIWLLYSVNIARLAEKQGQDSLTREQVAELPREGTLPVALLWLGVALIIMPMATRMVVDNATVLANYFAMSELTIGLTVIAIGTSLPELATAIAGARKGEDDIAIRQYYRLEHLQYCHRHGPASPDNARAV